MPPIDGERGAGGRLFETYRRQQHVWNGWADAFVKTTDNAGATREATGFGSIDLVRSVIVKTEGREILLRVGNSAQW